MLNTPTQPLLMTLLCRRRAAARPVVAKRQLLVADHGIRACGGSGVSLQRGRIGAPFQCVRSRWESAWGWAWPLQFIGSACSNYGHCATLCQSPNLPRAGSPDQTVQARRTPSKELPSSGRNAPLCALGNNYAAPLGEEIFLSRSGL